MRIGIAGAGVLGRLLSMRLNELGCEVTLFDRSRSEQPEGTSFVAAGMLSPYCELEHADTSVFDLGRASLEIWPRFLRQLEHPVFFQKEGSLVVAHPNDGPELERLKRQVVARVGDSGFQEVNGNGLSALEPQLDRRFLSGIYFPFEGQIHTQEFISASSRALSRGSVNCIFDTEVSNVDCAGGIFTTRRYPFDWVIDCRGLGAKKEIPELRAVRGELIWVEAPDVFLNRPVRLMHPRFPLYIVPRPNQTYLLGATQIESGDTRSITVRSTLELLSAAYTVHSGFSEARILKTSVGLRPAFPDHRPRVQIKNRLLRVNGLYRHGYLVAPQLAELVCHFILNGEIEAMGRSIFQL